MEKTQSNEGPMFDTTNSTSTWLFAIDKKITCHLCEPVLRIFSSNLCKFQKNPGNKRKRRQTDEPGWFQRVSLSCRRNRLVPFMLLGDVISSVGRKKRHCSSCQKIDASTTRTAPGISRLSSLFCISFFYFFSFPPCFLSFFAVAFFFLLPLVSFEKTHIRTQPIPPQSAPSFTPTDCGVWHMAPTNKKLDVPSTVLSARFYINSVIFILLFRHQY